MTFGFTSLHWDELTGLDTRIISLDSIVHIPAFPTLCWIAVSLVLCFQLRNTSLFGEMFQAVYWGLWIFKGLITDESMKVNSFVTGGGHQTLAFRPSTGSWWVVAAGTVHQLSDFILIHWMANYSYVWRVSPLTQTDILITPTLLNSFELPSNAGDPVYSQTLPTVNSPVLPFFYLQQPFPLLCFSFLINLLSYSILSRLSLSHSAFKASSFSIPYCSCCLFFTPQPWDLSGMQPRSIPRIH